MADNNSVIQSVQLSLRIIEHLQSVQEIGVTELAEELGHSPATTYKHLNTLHQEKYVAKTDEKRYRLGFRFVNTAYHVKQRISNYETIVGEVVKLANTSGEIALFTVEEHGIGICLSVAAGENAVDRPVHEGYRSYLHDTAVGKAILAFSSEERVEEIIDRWGLADSSPNTITEREELFETLSTIQERGVAFNQEETQHGLVGVGAPIFRPDGSVLGGISVIGPTSRISTETLAGDLTEMVQASANIIEVNDPDSSTRRLE